MHLPHVFMLLAVLAPLSSALTLSLSISPSNIIPNPSSLPASTRATLFKLDTSLTAPLSRANSFDFNLLAPGSYLATVQCRDFTFQPLRVDVEGGSDGAAVKVDAWQTFWGNEWGNKGEWRGGGNVTGEQDAVVVEVRPSAKREYYAARQGFNVLSFLKSPMILMALFSLVMIFGMPYIMDNMDEETRAEFEEMQSKSPLNKVAADPASALGNFDLASWMSGGSKKSESSGNDADAGAVDVRKR